MRKIFTLLFTALTAFAANAKDYNVPIIVTVNGVSTEQSGVVSIVENSGVYDLNLKNFVLQSSEGPMGVGNVELKDITPIQDGNDIILLANKLVTITDGDDISIPFWMAQMLPPVNVDLRGKITNDNLRCFIDIDLTEALQQVIQVEIGKGYQIANAGFETWHTSSGNYVEPNAWHSFESATGSLASMAGHHITKSDDAHSGDACARIFATSLFGVIANGTMTTGRMNAGSMTASNTANNAYLDMSKTDVDGNGDPFYTTLVSRPDSIAAWIKFKQGKTVAAHPYATISAIITDGTYYQDPEDKVYSNVVAKAKNNTIATTNGEWVRVVVPFNYLDNYVEPQALLVTISTNADPGSGSANDEVLVDDIAIIYNAKATGIKINGEDVPDFSSDKYIYNIDASKVVTADDIVVTTNGEAAHVIKFVTDNGDTTACTIMVLGGDMSKINTYVVNVKNTATAIHNIQTTDSKTASYYTLDGRKADKLMPGKVYINRNADGTVSKIRR